MVGISLDSVGISLDKQYVTPNFNSTQGILSTTSVSSPRVKTSTNELELVSPQTVSSPTLTRTGNVHERALHKLRNKALVSFQESMKNKPSYNMDDLEFDYDETEKPPLNAGDIIQYYEVDKVAGSTALVTSTITKVTPNSVGILTLCNGDYIPNNHYVMRVKEYKNGKLNDLKNPSFYEVDQYTISPSELPTILSQSTFSHNLEGINSRIESGLRNQLTQDEFGVGFVRNVFGK